MRQILPSYIDCFKRKPRLVDDVTLYEGLKSPCYLKVTEPAFWAVSSSYMFHYCSPHPPNKSISRPCPLCFWIKVFHKPGRWHNGSAFVFCPGDCPFKFEPSLTSAHAYREMTDCVLASKRLASVAPEVDLRNVHYICHPKNVNKAEPTLALKPRGDITRNPKQGYQWRQKRTCVRQKL